MAYRIEETKGSVMSLSTSKIMDVRTFEVRWEGDTDWDPAWSGRSFYATATPRQIAGYRMAATRAQRLLQAHFDASGERAEVVERERRQLEYQARKVAERIAYLDKWIPKCQAELVALLSNDAEAIAHLMRRT